MGVARGVLLRLEERIKVPEGRLDVVGGGHLGEAHLCEDLAELRAHLEQRMQVAAREGQAQRLRAWRAPSGAHPFCR